MKIDSELDKILKRVEKPARYIGGEVNMAVKDADSVSVRFGFAFPDIYEIGMSYTGMQILYDILNRDEAIYCERIFAPAKDMERIMREEGRELFTLETFTPIKDLDIIGFTLQYEMSYTNILNMLDLGNIPVRRRERREAAGGSARFPIVIAGGPCAFNPEPLADFVDVFLIGDGEELLKDVCLAYDHAARTCAAAEVRESFLKAISGLDGVYIPEYYEAGYGDDGTIAGYKRSADFAPERIKKAVIRDIDGADFPVKNIVPFIDTVHDRAVVEIFRGCTHGCRFCQAGMIYRPVRERKAETIRELAMEQLRNTGHDELSLLSLSTSDYSEFEKMAAELMRLCREKNVALSLPSLRLDSFSFDVLNEIRGYRKSGLTFAPEAGTRRLRDVINKNITDEDIYGAAEQAIRLGWEHLKLYFMIGLPTETDEDLDGIAEIAKKIMGINYDIRGRKGGRFKLTVSVANFVPKPHTPFQWEAQNRPEEFVRKHDYLSSKLRIKGVSFSYHEAVTSNLEAALARGDRRMGAVIETAWKKGCTFDAWTEDFDAKLWAEAFEECSAGAGFDCGEDMEAFYNYRRRDSREILPWDMIDPLVSREFLISERARARDAETSPDCRKRCLGCGVNTGAECFKNCRFEAGAEDI